MTTVCSRCLLMKSQVSPLNDGVISHGLCREHKLEALLAADLATLPEIEEFESLREEYVAMTVRVPSRVAARMRALTAVMTRCGGPAPDLSIIGGLALAREINRSEYEPFPFQVYSPIITSFQALAVRAQLISTEQS